MNMETATGNKKTSRPERRICWPNPDATCLEGGCTYCNDSPYRSLNVIRQYVDTAGEVRNRGDGKFKPTTKAYNTGERNLWFGRVDYRGTP